MALTLDRYPDLVYAAVPPVVEDLEDLRLLRKWEAALGYRIFAANRWGQLGDGHVSARDPILTDHFWVLGYGIPFARATVHDLTLVGPGGVIVEGPTAGGINTAAYCIHGPILDARSDLVAAAHTHTAYGTPWSANVRPFAAISQEAHARSSSTRRSTRARTSRSSTPRAAGRSPRRWGRTSCASCETTAC
ncbi:MAG: class II aldolase/adducin family protein [Acidimicrobiales bacterium]